MAKQIIKGFTMLMIGVALAFVTTVASAYGQSSLHTVAKIPFEFVIGGKTLPAGEYGVAGIEGNGQLVRVQSTEDNQSAVRLTTVITSASAPSTGKLVFHRYANQYFLTEVWMPGDNRGRQLTKSKQQRAVEREMAATSSRSERAQSGYEIIVLVATR
jgi:hypothetical protein